MTTNTTRDKTLAYGLLRIVLGINIAVHGISRLLSGPRTFAVSLVPQFAHTPLPSWSVYLFALSLPWVETLVGVGVLLGVTTQWWYVAGLLEIAALTFGTTLRQDWESAGLQLTYAFIYAALLATREYNTLSIDGLMGKKT
jgi:thiosulfate dehydrogenase [quinone] large subunit